MIMLELNIHLLNGNNDLVPLYLYLLPAAKWHKAMRPDIQVDINMVNL